MKNIAIGLIGTVLDSGYNANRWNRWRPTVALCQHEELLVDRLEILCPKKFTKLANVIIQDIQGVSPETQVKIHEVEFKDPWDLEEVYGALHDWARSYPFDTENEEYLVHITTGTHVAQICLYLLTEAHYLPGKLIQTSPPPKSNPNLAQGIFKIIDLDLSKYDRIASRFHKEHKEGVSFLKSGIETKNKTFNRLIEQIEKVAIASHSPILLTGPTGAGKSQLARKIFELKKSRRQVEGSFVEVNCATLKGEMAMSSLFGHVKGAFTGAMQERAGLLRAAHKGILFLDEIGELGTDEQAMLLRALEEKSFLPVGSDHEVSSEFQLIAGTNRNLSEQVVTGGFREDLLARINVWTFLLPGLKDRREDIEPNIAYELDQISRNQQVQITFNKEARSLFLKFSKSANAEWKGNFRDLNAAINRMSTLSSGGRINTDIVKEEIVRLQKSWEDTGNLHRFSILDEMLSPEQLQELDLFDRPQLDEVMRVCRSVKTISEAGRILFANTRKKKKSSNDSDRLRKYLAKFNLTWQDFLKN